MLKESSKITIGIGIGIIVLIVLICLSVVIPIRLSAISQSIQEIRVVRAENIYNYVAGEGNIECIKESFWGDAYIVTYKETEKKDPIIPGKTIKTSRYDEIIKSDYVYSVIYGQPVQEEDK